MHFESSATAQNPSRPVNVDSPSTVYTSARNKTVGHLSIMMRWIGVIILLSGIVTFMLQGIDTVSFLTRHWLFLGLTVLFGCTGIILGLKFKETKGARTFLGLAIAAIPALFTQLGGMLLVLIDPPAHILPRVLVAPPLSTTLLLVTICITTLLSLLIVIFGFRVFVQKHVVVFTSIYSAACLAILYPERAGLVSGLILLAYCTCIALIEKFHFRFITSLSTPEAIIARLLILAPPIVMIVRNSFYAASEVYTNSLLIVTGIFCFFALPFTIPKSLQGFIQLMGAIAFTMAGIRSLTPVFENMSSLFPNAIFTGCFCVTLVILTLSAGTMSVTAARWYRGIAAAFLTYGTIAILVEGADPLASLPSIAASILIIIVTRCTGEKWLFYTGICTGAIGIVNCCIRVTQCHTNLVWVFLALAGTCILIIASILDAQKSEHAVSSPKMPD